MLPRFATTLVLAAACAASQVLPVHAMPSVNLAHLDWLRRDVERGDGQKLAYWQIYATPETPGNRKGAYKYVEAGGEGVGCVDDVARAAIVYANEAQRTGDKGAWRQAHDALAFVHALAAGDGTYYNFIFADGRINKDGQTSHKGLTWWTARALWASAVGAHAFAKRDPAFAAMLRQDAGKTVEKLLWDTVPHYRRYASWGPSRIPAWFMGGAPDVTAVAVLGLAALYADSPSPVVKLLLHRYGEAIAEYHAGDDAHYPYHAHLPSQSPTTWHGYGAHMLHALAVAGKVLNEPRLIHEARKEADHFCVHLLLEGGPVDAFTPAPRPYPQIAYGVETQVNGLMALYDATGEARYGKLAGLFGSWLQGDNAAAVPMYDPATGRVWDGIDATKDLAPDAPPGDASFEAGAESTIEGLMALQTLAAHPRFLPYADARPLVTDPRQAFAAPTIFEAEQARGATRVVQAGGEAWSGDKYALVQPGEALRWTVRQAGDFMLLPVMQREHHLEGERAVLRLSSGGSTQAFRPVYPQANAPWPTTEAGSFGRPFHLNAGDEVVASYAATARQALSLDGVVVQPVVKLRGFRVGNTALAVARNYTDEPRAFTWPGAAGQAAKTYPVQPYETLLVERALDAGTGVGVGRE